MNRLQRLEKRLNEVFEPEFLEVRDDSHHHAGHSGARPGGETHYHVTIKSLKFKGITKVSQHRLVNDALKAEFDQGLHALSLTTQA